MAHITGHADEPEPNTLAWTKWKNSRAPQDPEAYQRAVARWKATQFEELSTGKAHPRVTRRIDYDKHRGAFTSQRRTRDPLHCKRPTLVVYSQPHCGIDGTRGVARAGRRVTRPRGPRPQRSSASRSRSSSGDSDGSEPGPGPRRPGEKAVVERIDPTDPKKVARAILRLSSLACDVDELVSILEDVRLSDPELLYLDLPLLHLTHCVARAGQLVYEGQKIDDRPRSERLGRAA